MCARVWRQQYRRGCEGTSSRNRVRVGVGARVKAKARVRVRVGVEVGVGVEVRANLSQEYLSLQELLCKNPIIKRVLPHRGGWCAVEN